jgi:hypothetical protein
MEKSGAGSLDETVGTLKRAVSAHHQRIIEIDRQLGELSQERALIKAAAVRELGTSLKLPNELIGHLVAGCL